MPLTRGRRPTRRSAGPGRSRRAAGRPRRTPPAGATAPRSPRGAGGRRPGPARARRALPTAATGSATTTSGRPASEHTTALGQQRQERVERQPVDHAAQHDTAGRSRRGGTPDAPTLRRWSPSSRCSMARSATAPRGSTPCAAAPRCVQRVHAASPSPQSAWTISPPGVHASTWAATGPAHAPSSRAGTSQAAPSTGRSWAASLASSVSTLRRQEAKGLDHVAHRLFELGLLAVAVPRARGAIPSRAQPVEGAGPPCPRSGLPRPRRRGPRHQGGTGRSGRRDA